MIQVIVLVQGTELLEYMGSLGNTRVSPRSGSLSAPTTSTELHVPASHEFQPFLTVRASQVSPSRVPTKVQSSRLAATVILIRGLVWEGKTEGGLVNGGTFRSIPLSPLGRHQSSPENLRSLMGFSLIHIATYHILLCRPLRTCALC